MSVFWHPSTKGTIDKILGDKTHITIWVATPLHIPVAFRADLWSNVLSILPKIERKYTILHKRDYSVPFLQRVLHVFQCIPSTLEMVIAHTLTAPETKLMSTRIFKRLIEVTDNFSKAMCAII